MAASLIASVTAFLRQFPPFDRLEADALAFVASKLTLAYYPKDAVILSPTGAPPLFFHIVQDGLVRQIDSDTGAIVTLGPGEAFSVGALIEQRQTHATYAAALDTFCYRLAVSDFNALLERSARFREFSTEYLRSLLRDSRRIQQMQSAAALGDEQMAHRPLRSLVQRAPVACTPDTPIGEALRTMQHARVGSMLVVSAGGALGGILTRHDVLERIALARCDLASPISSVMTPTPLTLPADATAYDAALLIARKGIRHVPVLDAGRVIGVVTERDLFALQHVTLRGITRTIAGAADLPALQAAARDIRALAQRMLRQGLAAEQLTYIISTLNDALTTRVLEIEQRRHGVEDLRWCWLAFGSEGRYEQTISTDQDNGLIFTSHPDADAEAARARLLPFARAVNVTLDACGFPLCRGNIMAGNPLWCLSVTEWHLRFERWISNAQPEQLLEAIIFFDFRPLHGERELADTLRGTLGALLERHPVFLRQLAREALRTRPPLGAFGSFSMSDHPDAPDTIDLKMSGARIFVDAARVMALAAGVAHTNTAQRLRHAAPKINLPSDEISAATDAFFFIQLLRLRAQIGVDGGANEPNRVDPERLNEIDRRILKESFRQARNLQSRLALDYQL